MTAYRFEDGVSIFSSAVTASGIGDEAGIIVAEPAHAYVYVRNLPRRAATGTNLAIRQALDYVGNTGTPAGTGYTLYTATGGVPASFSQYSDLDGTRYATLSQADPLGVTWDFHLSTALADRQIYARRFNYLAHDYSEDDAGTFLTQTQYDHGWYAKDIDRYERITVLGGVDDLIWRVVLSGMGDAILTDDYAAADVEGLVADHTYRVEVRITPAEDDPTQLIVSTTLLDRATLETLASVTTIRTSTLERLYMGATGELWGTEIVEIGWEAVTILVPAEEGYTLTPEELELVGGDPADVVTFGWGTEVCIVTDGTFETTASPARGSANVFDAEGGILHYGFEWEETDDTGLHYRLVGVDTASVMVVYLVVAPDLATHIIVSGASEEMEKHGQALWTDAEIVGLS